VLRRPALGTYNFAGDLGKSTIPALAAWLIASTDWTIACRGLGLAVVAAALGIAVALLSAPAGDQGNAGSHSSPAEAAPADGRRVFALVAGIGIIDSATRTGFLTFLPFLLAAKGASLPLAGWALALVFTGGACGKFLCGWVTRWVGTVAAVVLTEAATAAGVAACAVLPLDGVLMALMPLGVVMNGTSSVLYGTVAELVPPARRAGAFALFYTVTIGAGAVAPALYGLAGDWLGVEGALGLVAAMALGTLPLAGILSAAGHRVR
jgi:predicted MFS family arabinose efflux permease